MLEQVTQSYNNMVKATSQLALAICVSMGAHKSGNNSVVNNDGVVVVAYTHCLSCRVPEEAKS